VVLSLQSDSQRFYVPLTRVQRRAAMAAMDAERFLETEGK
jgi:hypothetical protein